MTTGVVFSIEPVTGASPVTCNAYAPRAAIGSFTDLPELGLVFRLDSVYTIVPVVAGVYGSRGDEMPVTVSVPYVKSPRVATVLENNITGVSSVTATVSEGSLTLVGTLTGNGAAKYDLRVAISCS
jgi:hypothetical protein